MPVELHLPSPIHYSEYTDSGISFDLSQSDIADGHRFITNLYPDKVLEDSNTDIGLYQLARLRLTGHVLREAEGILATSNCPVEAKARLLKTGYFTITTTDPGEVLSIIGYYGTKLEREGSNWPFLLVRAEDQGAQSHRLEYFLCKHKKPFSNS
jgi:hypothetical protein